MDISNMPWQVALPLFVGLVVTFLLMIQRERVSRRVNNRKKYMMWYTESNYNGTYKEWLKENGLK